MCQEVGLSWPFTGTGARGMRPLSIDSVRGIEGHQSFGAGFQFGTAFMRVNVSGKTAQLRALTGTQVPSAFAERSCGAMCSTNAGLPQR